MKKHNEKIKNEFKRRLYLFVLRLVRFVKSLPKESVNDVLTKQLLRSGTSVLANYIEATSASSKRDFINFFSYSLKSANESKVWLALLRDVNKIKNKELDFLLREVVEVSNVLAASILTMKGKR